MQQFNCLENSLAICRICFVSILRETIRYLEDQKHQFHLSMLSNRSIWHGTSLALVPTLPLRHLHPNPGFSLELQSIHVGIRNFASLSLGCHRDTREPSTRFAMDDPTFHGVTSESRSCVLLDCQ